MLDKKLLISLTEIDADAEREALALSKVDKRERPRRLRFETDSYGKSKFNKLFKK